MPARLSHMPLRMEFLDAGEKLGWPRIGELRAGQGPWETWARLPIQRVVGKLRAAKVRVDNLNGEKESELDRVMLMGDRLRYGVKAPHEITTQDRYDAYKERLRAKRIAGLAKAREIKRQKQAAAKEAVDAPEHVLQPE